MGLEFPLATPVWVPSPVFIPIGTDRPLSRPTRINHVLVGINIGVHLALAVLAAGNPDLAERVQGHLLLWRGAEPWGYLTYAFLHGGWWHLLGNMLVLWVFGANVEDRFGRIGYLAFYLVAAVASGAMHIVIDGAPVVGASGAVAGVTGAYIVLFPRTRIKTFIIFIFIGAYMVPAWFFVGFAVLKDLLLFGSDSGIAHIAHLAGYAFGAGLSIILLATKLLKRETFDLFSMLERRKRLGDIRSAHQIQQRRIHRQVEASPEQDSPQARIARLVAEGDLETALREYEAVEIGPEPYPRATLLRLGEHAVESQNWSAAASAFEGLAGSYPDDPEAGQALMMLGLISWRDLGDAPRARGALERACEILDPEESAYARELLLDIERAVGTGESE